MMRRYPAYRDSGVEWLGEVPEGWRVAPVKAGFTIVGGATPKSEVSEYWDGDIIWVTPADLSDLSTNVLKTSRRAITELGLASCATSLVPAGSLLLSIRAPIGSLAISSGPVCTNQGCKALVARPDINPSFYYFVLLAAREALNVLGRGSTFLELSGDQLGAFRVPVPRLAEQTTIAAFLDQETAKIDSLVDEQHRLIMLLREKRQAVISHAVTKGLNPAAPMKPSGVDRLGDVPEGWTVAAIKRYCAKITDGAHISPDTEGGVFPFVSTKDVSEQGIDLENCLLTSETSFRCMQSTGCQPYPGDILFSKDGTIGRTAIVNSEIEFVVASSLIIIRPRPEEVTSDFLNYLCQSKMVVSQVSSFVKGAGLPRLSITNLLKIVGSFPPLMQQQQIVDFLDGEVTKLDALGSGPTIEARR